MIIPSKDGEQRIQGALKSIKEQTFTDYELIVVCDSCSDNTKGVAQSFGAIVLETDARDPGLAKNPAIDTASGEYLLFCNDDDYYTHKQAFELIDANLLGCDVLCFGFIMGALGYRSPLGNSGNLFPAETLKAFRREFVGDTRFQKAWEMNDVIFSRDIFSKQPVVRLLNSPIYYHDWMRPGSITERLSQGEKVEDEHGGNGSIFNQNQNGL